MSASQHPRCLLETTGDPIDQVRRQADCDDPAAFRRVFKQATGLSPGGHRDAYGLRPISSPAHDIPESWPR
jgi:transcriptional regulator GlxA family with amidase domain